MLEKPAAKAVGGAQSVVAERGRQNRRRLSGAVFGVQVLLVVLLIVGMYALNRTSGNLIMPNPADVLDESIKLWSNGSMLRGLGETMTVLVLGFLLSAATGILGG